MEQTSSKNKIVSLHLQRCLDGCPNASVCYHKRKDLLSYEKLDDFTQTFIKMRYLDRGFKVHESLCETDKLNTSLELLQKFKNYNITVSTKHLKLLDYDHYDNIQISVYDREGINLFRKYQKLFLVKNHKTYHDFFSLLQDSKEEDTGRLHFLFEANFITNRNIKVIIQEFQKCKNKLITLDTCFSSWLINGHCPFDSNNYIDISYDGIRKCPYEINGKPYLNLTDDECFNLEFKPNCIYKKIFKGELKDGEFGKHSEHKDSDTNSGTGTNSKCMWRLSLRS